LEFKIGDLVWLRDDFEPHNIFDLPDGDYETIYTVLAIDKIGTKQLINLNRGSLGNNWHYAEKFKRVIKWVILTFKEREDLLSQVGEKSDLAILEWQKLPIIVRIKLYRAFLVVQEGE